MTCPECGRWASADRETGYDADDYCSAECEEKAQQRGETTFYLDGEYVGSLEEELHDQEFLDHAGDEE